MSHRVPVLAFLACLVASATAGAAPAVLESIPLKWSPTSTLAEMGQVDLTAPDLAVKIHVDALADGRQNPTLIALNTEKPDKPRQVTTSADVGAFVTEHLKDTLRGAGLSIVDGPAPLPCTHDLHD